MVSKTQYYIYYSLLVIFSFSAFQVSAQYDALPLTRSVRLQKGDSIFDFHMRLNAENVKPQKDTRYFWFASDSIFSNVGGFSGMLLHDKYEVFGVQNALLVQGNYKNGQRIGEWKYWYINGGLKKIENYKKGLLHGKYSVYSITGELLRETEFRKRNKHGKEEIYEGGKVVKVTYFRKGEEKEKKPLLSFLKKEGQKDEKKKERKRKKATKSNDVKLKP